MTKIAQPNSTLKRDPARGLQADPEKTREFVDRGRRNSKMGKTAGGRPRQQVIGNVTDRQREWARALPCLGCGAVASQYVAIDFAHIVPGGFGHCGSILDGFPLCRRANGSGCHRRFDRNTIGDTEPLDLLSVIRADWERWHFHFHHAVRHAGDPVAVLERLAGARTQWSDLA